MISSVRRTDLGRSVTHTTPHKGRTPTPLTSRQDRVGRKWSQGQGDTTIACFKLSSFRNFSTFCFTSTSSLFASCLEDVLSKSLPVSYSLHIHHIARIRSNRLQAYAQICLSSLLGWKVFNCVFVVHKGSGSLFSWKWKSLSSRPRGKVVTALAVVG